MGVKIGVRSGMSCYGKKRPEEKASLVSEIIGGVLLILVIVGVTNILYNAGFYLGIIHMVVAR